MINALAVDGSVALAASSAVLPPGRHIASVRWSVLLLEIRTAVCVWATVTQ
jgi:hypothetical protein